MLIFFKTFLVGMQKFVIPEMSMFWYGARLATYTHENMRQLNFFNGKTGTFLGVLLLHNFVGPGQYQKGPFFIFIDTLVMKLWMGPKYVIFSFFYFLLMTQERELS